MLVTAWSEVIMNTETIRFFVELAFGSGILASLARLIFDTGKVVNRIEHLETEVRQLGDRLEQVERRVLALENKFQRLSTKISILWKEREPVVAPVRVPTPRTRRKSQT